MILRILLVIFADQIIIIQDKTMCNLKEGIFSYGIWPITVMPSITLRNKFWRKASFSILSRIRHPEAFMNDKRVVLIFDFQVFILFGSILQLLFNKFKSNLYLNKSVVLWYPPKRNKNSNFDQSTSFWLWGLSPNRILYDMTNNQHYSDFEILYLD